VRFDVTLWEVINSSREKYLDAYRATLRTQRAQMADLKAEVLVQVNGPGAENVPADYKLFRVDLLWVQDGQPQVGAIDGGAVASAGAGAGAGAGAEGCEVTYPGGQRLRVVGLRWDECEFRMTPAVDVDAPLRAWLAKWQDRQEQNVVDADGLHVAVHSATPPGRSPDGQMTGFAVDFGSAPPEAFTALVSALLAAGAEAIQVG
jgi:hypothetical protein